MNILAVAPVCPYPATDGLRLVIAGHLTQLMRRGHQVTLFCFGDDATGLAPHQVQAVPSPLATSRYRAVALARSWLTTMPYQVAVMQSSALQQALAAWARTRRYDLMLIEHLNMTTCAAVGRAAGLPVVLVAHNVESILFARAAAVAGGLRRWHYVRQARLLAGYEAALECQVDQVVALSANDAAEFRRLSPELAVKVVGPAVDLELLTPGAQVKEEAGAVMMTGVMSFPPNVDAAVWFCREVWPRVLQAVPHARLDLVGKQPVAAVRRLADGRGVRVIGAVPDIRPWLVRGQVMVAPLRAGSGVRIKLLEAMAMGKAIVATTIGAEGLGVQHGRELLLADQPAEFAAAVIELLRNGASRAALGHAAQQYVEREHAPETVATKLEQTLQEAVCRA
jgi:glycosyltransferase involved in cell wall biosynthesis